MCTLNYGNTTNNSLNLNLSILWFFFFLPRKHCSIKTIKICIEILVQTITTIYFFIYD